jgi:hypothetical protein
MALCTVEVARVGGFGRAGARTVAEAVHLKQEALGADSGMDGQMNGWHCVQIMPLDIIQNVLMILGMSWRAAGASLPAPHLWWRRRVGDLRAHGGLGRPSGAALDMIPRQTPLCGVWQAGLWSAGSVAPWLLQLHAKISAVEASLCRPSMPLKTRAQRGKGPAAPSKCVPCRPHPCLSVSSLLSLRGQGLQMVAADASSESSSSTVVSNQHMDGCFVRGAQRTSRGPQIAQQLESTAQRPPRRRWCVCLALVRVRVVGGLASTTDRALTGH